MAHRAHLRPIWLGRCGRRARDHEATPFSALAVLTLAAAMMLVKRFAQPFWNGV